MMGERHCWSKVLVSLRGGILLGVFFFLGSHAWAWKWLPREAVLIYPRIDGVGYLVQEDLKGIGQVVTTRAEKEVLIGENEVVYLDVGSRDGIRVGDRLEVYRLFRPRELKDYKVVLVEGRLRVIEVNETESAAMVEEAYLSISMGSRVDYYRPRNPRIELRVPPESLEGRIIWTYEGLTAFGKGDIVFLDRGAVDGVEPGQCFEIYRVPMEGTEPLIPYPKRTYHFQRPTPQKHLTTVVGEVMVLQVQKTTATALVTKSFLPLEVGDRYRAGCGWSRELVARRAEAPAAVTPGAREEEAAVEGEEEALRRARAAFENEDVHFAFDSYALDAEAQRILREKAAFLKAHPEYEVLIEGHCDERGTEQYNLALGDRRANAAKFFLVGLGVDEGRLRTISYGEERPLDPGHNEAAWARNRRAHFVIQNP